MTAWTGIKLLGFKSRKELAFEDNIKHSTFIYPDEMVRHSFLRSGAFIGVVPEKLWGRLCQTYSGSKRTFTALLRTMISKKKIAIALALTRRNASPIFCAVLPQVRVPL